MVQPSLDSLEKQLENLHSVLLRIQMAETDIKVRLTESLLEGRHGNEPLLDKWHGHEPRFDGRHGNGLVLESWQGVSLYLAISMEMSFSLTTAWARVIAFSAYGINVYCTAVDATSMPWLPQVVEAYRSGVTVLKALREEQGLQVDKVEGVMDDLKEASYTESAHSVAQC